MPDYRILKFLDIFKAVFERFGIDYYPMRKILQAKILLDSRRTATLLQSSKGEEYKDGNHFYKSLGLYLFLGLIMIPLVLLSYDYLFQMTIIFAIFMFFMMTTLISDFSSVLLDLRDKEILLSKPISKRTLNMAKLLHISFYISMITIAMMGLSLLISLIRRGFIFFLIYLVAIILINIFLIVATGLTYLIILRFFDGERLKDMINYVQIGLTISLAIGYQLIARVFNFVGLSSIDFTGRWWSYFLPPIWFAAPFELILNNNRDKHMIIYSLMALIIPIASMIIYIKLMPVFEKNLQKLTSTGGSSGSKNRFSNLLSKLICRTKEERNFYRFSTSMIKNERIFKLKVYPSLGMGFIFPILMLFTSGGETSLVEIANSKMYFNIYLIAFALIVLLQFLSYSGNYKGAWIYQVLPISHPESIYKGAVKAVFVKLFTPLFIVVSLVFLFIFKAKIIPHIIIIYLNMMLATCIIFRLNKKALPFSRSFPLYQKGGIREMLVSAMTIGVLFGLHFFLERISYGTSLYLLMLVILNMIAWKYAFKVEAR